MKKEMYVVFVEINSQISGVIHQNTEMCVYCAIRSI